MENEEKTGNEAEKETSPVKLPYTIKLKRPVQTSEGEISEIVLKREPTGGDWSGFNMANPTIGDFQRVGAKLAGLPLPDIKRIDTKATVELVEVVSRFFEQS
jgi:hypothetical protein